MTLNFHQFIPALAVSALSWGLFSITIMACSERLSPFIRRWAGITLLAGFPLLLGVVLSQSTTLSLSPEESSDTAIRAIQPALTKEVEKSGEFIPFVAFTDLAADTFTSSFALEWPHAWRGAIPVFGWIWLAGIVVLAGVMGREIFLLARVRRSGRRIFSHSGCPVVESPFCPAVYCAGLLHPEVFFPVGLVKKMSHAECESILAHEQAHISHGDIWLAYAQSLIDILFWWNPTVWLLRRQINRACEEACDTEVIELTNDPATYAQSLIKAAEHTLAMPWTLAPGASGDFCRLKARVTLIFADQRRQRPSWRSRLALALPASILALVMAGCFSSIGFADELTTENESPGAAELTSPTSSSSNKQPAAPEPTVTTVPASVTPVALPLSPIVVQAPIVLIDPGHGGHDTGAKGSHSIESEIMVKLAQEVADWLRKAGLRVESTRSTNITKSLADRIAMAEKLRPALFLSLHADYSPSSEKHGLHVFEADNRGLGKVFSTALATETGEPVNISTRKMRILSGNNIPSLLLEAGFLSNADDEARLMDDAKRETLVCSIGKAVQAALKPEPVTPERKKGSKK